MSDIYSIGSNIPLGIPQKIEQIVQLQNRIAQLEADLAEARKDQARYQWIRNESWAMYNYNKGKPHLVTFDSLQRPTHLAENAVDQAIDAAIKEQGK